MPIFFIIPPIYLWISYVIYESEHDLVECQDEFTCENDDLPESDLDKFDPKIMFKPKGPGDF